MAKKQFSTRKKIIEFSIDDDDFRLKPVIPASVLFEFQNLQSNITTAMNDPEQSIADIILDMFSKLLDDKSFEVFNARFFGVTPEPLDFETFNEVTEYILEEVAGKGVGQRSSSSTSASPAMTSGPSSTDGA